LRHQEPSTKINAQIKSCKSTFRLPEDNTTPVIFIAAGTGFSPFRGFLQERHAKGLKSSKKNTTEGAENSECYMFFGCRHPDQDFIYKEEFDAYLEDGTLTELYTTFSRCGEVVKYVQHALLKEANLLYKLTTEHNAKVYVCGAAGSMAKDVKRTWERILVQMSGMSEPEACEELQSWVDNGKYNEDVWG
jgi:cytochrome P450/NADPH-cytochrome P450 reductase